MNKGSLQVLSDNDYEINCRNVGVLQTIFVYKRNIYNFHGAWHGRHLPYPGKIWLLV